MEAKALFFYFAKRKKASTIIPIGITKMGALTCVCNCSQ